VAAELGEVLSPRAPVPRVIHNPIVSDALRARARTLRPPDGSRAPVPDEALALGVPDGARLILSVGRLAPQKNHVLLLDAFARLAGERKDAHLVILGEGRERPALERRLEELELRGRAHLPGFVGDPAPWYAAASAFVLSSNWEGLPTVLIEALLYGCPIVSTRCPSGPEEILEDGRYGRLVPMNDTGALADAIGATLADPPAAEPLRRRAEEFGIDRAVGEYLAVLLPGEAG
jgi:glycosyltransferase involved in cell wall biosynthesis